MQRAYLCHSQELVPETVKCSICSGLGVQEMKKMRKQRREERETEKQQNIQLGLMEAPADKVHTYPPPNTHTHSPRASFLWIPCILYACVDLLRTCLVLWFLLAVHSKAL